MQKKIDLFRVRPAKPDPEWLGVNLVQRRLARQRQLMTRSQPVTDWLDLATADWQARHAKDPLSMLIDAPTVDDYPHYPTRLTSAERNRIMTWIKARVNRMADASPLPVKLAKSEKEALIEAAKNMHAVYLTDHQVDVAFAAVHENFPWLGRLTEKAWRVALRRVKSGLPVGVGAMLVTGPPGLGKSSWARAVAKALALPSLEVDVGTTGGVFDIQGTPRGWGSAEKGRLISTIINDRLGNPAIILDEIDAGSRSVGITRGSIPGLFKVLTAVTEPSTAKAWVCPYYQIPFDLRHVSWICTSNDTAHIEQALLDRLVVVDIPNITHRQLLEFTSREANKRFGEAFGEAVVVQIADTLKRGHRPSLRHVVRLLDRVEDSASKPLLH